MPVVTISQQVKTLTFNQPCVTFVTRLMTAANWDPTEFHAAIQRWLERTGMSQTEAARAAGLRQSVLNKWMQPSGYNAQPTTEALERLQPAIGIPMDELLRIAGRRKADPPDVPAELLDALLHMQYGYNESDEQERQIRLDATYAIWSPRQHRRRPNRRDVGKNQPHGDPKMEYGWLTNHQVDNRLAVV